MENLTQNEKNFKKNIIDKQPNGICLNAVEDLIKGYESHGIDTTKMRQMVSEKIKRLKETKELNICIFPLKP